MNQVFDWRSSADSGGIVHRAVQALTDGRIVAFPTETVYGLAASALIPEAVERLWSSKGRAEDKPLTLAIRDAAEAGAWVPGISRLGQRLARRCWPGPVTLVFSDDAEHGLAGRLPDVVRHRVCPAGTLGLRVPDHDAIRECLAHLPGPLALTSANRSGKPPAVTAEQVLQTVGPEVDLIIDDGPTHYGRASTVVRVSGNSWNVLREGVISTAELERQSRCVIVFVCTGNTCRSPLAEALCKKRLADRLGCKPEDLPERGFLVHSAGVAAMIGDRATAEAVDAARELGMDLTGHASRPLTADLVAQADYLVAMTSGHLAVLVTRYASEAASLRLLCPEGNDIPDPIGCDQQVYRRCSLQIAQYIDSLVAEIEATGETSPAIISEWKS